MDPFSPSRSQPIIVSSSVESQVYLLFALAMALTVVGSYVGALFAATLLTTGMTLLLVVAELAIVLTARWWMNASPLNMVLFALFPLLSGITVTPILMDALYGYANGSSILINALAATAFMAAAAAVFARTTHWNLAFMGRALLFAVIGLIGLGLLQIIGVVFGVSFLASTGFELFVSGAGIVVFALFTAYDLQRIQTQARVGANPFLMALSLYLDIFNLFLYILRFMLAMSGRRR